MSKKIILATLFACSLLTTVSCSSSSSSSSSSTSVSRSTTATASDEDTATASDKRMRTTQSFESPFTSIDAATGLCVRYIQGSPASMTIEGSNRDISIIKAYVKSGCLYLERHTEKKGGLKGFFKPQQFSGKVQITVTAPDVNEFDCSTGVILTIDAINNYKKVDIEIGTGGILNAGVIQSPAVDIDCSTGAVANIDNLKADKASLEASTGATINVSGQAEDASLDASTGATINAGNLICTTASVDASVGASITFNATRDSTDISTGATVRNLRK